MLPCVPLFKGRRRWVKSEDFTEMQGWKQRTAATSDPARNGTPIYWKAGTGAAATEKVLANLNSFEKKVQAWPAHSGHTQSRSRQTWSPFNSTVYIPGASPRRSIWP